MVAGRTQTVVGLRGQRRCNAPVRCGVVVVDVDVCIGRQSCRRTYPYGVPALDVEPSMPEAVTSPDVRYVTERWRRILSDLPITVQGRL